MVRYNTVLLSKGNTRKVKSIIIHPDYYSSSYWATNFQIRNDIAILHLEKPFDFKLKNVGPICLPKRSDDPIDRTTLTVSEWIYNDDRQVFGEHLQTVDEPVVNRTFCNHQLDQFVKQTTQRVNDQMFCTGYKEGDKYLQGYFVSRFIELLIIIDVM